MSMITMPGGADAGTLRRERSRRLTPAQARARRNALWVFATEIGMPDAVTGRHRKHTPRELSQLWGCSKQAVLDGLASARSIRDRLSALADRD